MIQTTVAHTAKRRLKQGGRTDVIKARAKRRERQNLLRTSRIVSGLCPRCGSPVEGKSIHCVSCLEKFKAYSTRARIRSHGALKRLGICKYCKTENALPRHRACKVCHEKHRQCGLRLRAKRRSMGLCPECGEPAGKTIMCEACKARARAKWRNRKGKDEQIGK